MASPAPINFAILPNQSMKPRTQLQSDFSGLVATPCRGLTSLAHREKPDSMEFGFRHRADNHSNYH
jgi:hypothetical protein